MLSQQASSSPIVSPNIVASLNNVNKTFANQLALKDLKLHINANEVLAILGSNGAGKTTLINILLGRLQPDSGEVSIFGQIPGSAGAKGLTGAMLQVANLPETLKIKEHIKLFQSYYSQPMDYQQVLEYAGLSKMENRYSRKLSGGEKQRLLFALSICGNPKLLFLDEPSVGMDVEARQGLWQAIGDLKAQGTAIVLTTHYLPEAESLADQIVLLKEGEIIKRGNSDSFKASVSHKLLRFCSAQFHPEFFTLPAVVSLKQSGKYTNIQSNNVNCTLQALLNQFPQVEDLTVTGAGLEEAFMQLNQDSELSNLGSG